MEKREIVSRNLFEVKANASFSTKKPSTVTMEIDRRFSVVAYGHYIDQREGIEAGVGLKGFELVAVYEDGQPEPKLIEDITVETDEDHCEVCGKVVNEETGYFYTEDNVYLCEEHSPKAEDIEAETEKSETDQQEELKADELDLSADGESRVDSNEQN